MKHNIALHKCHYIDITEKDFADNVVVDKFDMFGVGRLASFRTPSAKFSSTIPMLM